MNRAGDANLNAAVDDDLEVEFTYQTTADPPVPINVTGYSARCSLLVYDGSEFGRSLYTPTVSVGTTNGLFSVTFTVAQLAALLAASPRGEPARFRVWITPGGGDEFELSHGAIRITTAGVVATAVDVDVFDQNFTVNVSARGAAGPAGPEGDPGAPGAAGDPRHMRNRRGESLANKTRLQVLGALLRGDAPNDQDVVDIGRVEPSEFGAVDTAATTTGTGTTASATITIAAGDLADELQNGDWIFWHQSGPAHGLDISGSQPIATVQGTTGATQFEFYWVALTTSWGYTAASPVRSISNANATLSTTNCIDVAHPTTPVPHAFKYLLYARRGGTGSFVFAGATIAYPLPSWLGHTHPSVVRLTSNSFAKTPPAGIPLVAPVAAVPNGARYQVISGGGTTTLTLDRAPYTNATGTVIEACSLVPLEDSMRAFATAHNDSGCGQIFIRKGYNWRITGDWYIDHIARLTGATRSKATNSSILKFKDGTAVVPSSRRMAQQYQPGTMYRVGDRFIPHDNENWTTIQIVTEIADGAEWGASADASVNPAFSNTPGVETVTGDVTCMACTSATNPQATTSLEMSIEGVSFIGEGTTIPGGRICQYKDLRQAPNGFPTIFANSIWTPGHAHQANRYVVPPLDQSTGLIYRAGGAGTSGASPPVFPRREGDTASDNGVTLTAVAMPISQGVGLHITTTTHLSEVHVSNVAGTGVLFDGALYYGALVNGSTSYNLDVHSTTGANIVVAGPEANATVHFHPEGDTPGAGFGFVQDDSAFGAGFFMPQNNGASSGYQNAPFNLQQSQSVIFAAYQEGSSGPGFDWNAPGCVFMGTNADRRAGATGLFVAIGTGANTVGDHAHASTDSSIEWRLRSNQFAIDYLAGTLAALTNSTLEWAWNTTTRRWQHRLRGNVALDLIEYAHYTARGQRFATPRGMLLGSGGIASPSSELLLNAVTALPTAGAFAEGDTQFWGLDSMLLALRASRRGGEGIVARANSTSYAAGALVSQGGRIFVNCKDTSGTTASSTAAFSGSETIGQRVVDGGVEWQCWHTTVQDSAQVGIPNLHAMPVAMPDDNTAVALAAVQECATLTANRTKALPSLTGLPNGTSIKVRRRTADAFTLAIGGLITMPAATKSTAVFQVVAGAWALGDTWLDIP